MPKFVNEVVSWHRDEGQVSAIFLTKATKYIRLLPMEGKLRVVQIPKTDEWRLKPVSLKGKPYPIKRAIRVFRKHAGYFGITASGKRALSYEVLIKDDQAPFVLEEKGEMESRPS